MEPTIPPEEQSLETTIQEAAEIVDQVGAYGSLITDSVLLIIIGMIVVFLLHTLTSKFLYPHLKNTRFIKVVFGTLYVLIIVGALLLTLDKLGFDTSGISKIAVLSVLVGAVVIFFLVPFLPRLPFIPGQMIEVSGVTGIVANISTIHTTIRTFDGAMVFIPNPVVLASKIINYHDVPERRLALDLTVSHDTNIKEAQELLLRLMNEEDRVLDMPAPPIVLVTEADAEGIKLTAYCWVKNGDWLTVRSDLWMNVVNAFNKDDRVTMSRPQQEIYVIDEKEA
jgi:small conductance mechanosensitive channel